MTVLFKASTCNVSRFNLSESTSIRGSGIGAGAVFVMAAAALVGIICSLGDSVGVEGVVVSVFGELTSWYSCLAVCSSSNIAPKLVVVINKPTRQTIRIFLITITSLFITIKETHYNKE